VRLDKPLDDRVEPNADGSYTFVTGRSVVAIVRFCGVLLSVFMAWAAYDMLSGGSPADLGSVMLWVALSTLAFLTVTFIPGWFRGTLTLSDEAIDQRGVLRRTRIPWAKVHWVWTGYDVRHVPDHPGGRGRPTGNSLMHAGLASMSADGWVVAIEDGRKRRILIHGPSLRNHHHARFVLRRLLRRHVDEGLIEDGIGFVKSN
jgi:hypothetical protein